MDHSLKFIISEDIPGLIEKASLFGGKVVQLTPDNRLESDIKSVKFGQNGKIFMDLTENLPFEKERPIAVTFSYRNLSYYLTSGQFNVEGNTLTSSGPTEARALDIREHERYVLPLDNKILSSIYRIERRGTECELEVQVVDVSSNGMGMLIHNAEESAILSNDHIWIKSINNTVLDKPIFGKIVFVMNRRYKNNVIDIRIGVSLEAHLPENLFSELKDLCRLILV